MADDEIPRLPFHLETEADYESVMRVIAKVDEEEAILGRRFRDSEHTKMLDDMRAQLRAAADQYEAKKRDAGD